MKKVISEKAIQSLASKTMVLDKYSDISLTELGLKLVYELFRNRDIKND